MLKSEFPSEFHKPAIPLIAWNLGSEFVFLKDVQYFPEICNNSI